MTADELQRALERLKIGRTGHLSILPTVSDVDIAKPLAALIEAAETLYDCKICGGSTWVSVPDGQPGAFRVLEDIQHAQDCALVALVRAINGDTP